MRQDHAIFSIMHLSMLLVLFSLGISSVTISYVQEIRLCFSEWILNSPQDVFWFGSVLCSFAILLFLSFMIFHKRQFFTVKMQNATKIHVEKSVIHAYVIKYWKEHFPEEPVPLDVIVRSHNALEILLPDNNKAIEDKFLQKAEKDLGLLFMQHLGYKDPFYLTIVY